MQSQACGLAPQGYSPWTSRNERLLSVAATVLPSARLDLDHTFTGIDCRAFMRYGERMRQSATESRNLKGEVQGE
jgi:hypothetical protein